MLNRQTNKQIELISSIDQKKVVVFANAPCFCQRKQDSEWENILCLICARGISYVHLNKIKSFVKLQERGPVVMKSLIKSSQTVNYWEFTKKKKQSNFLGCSHLWMSHLSSFQQAFLGNAKDCSGGETGWLYLLTSCFWLEATALDCSLQVDFSRCVFVFHSRMVRFFGNPTLWTLMHNKICEQVELFQ